MGTISLRPARPEDVPALRALIERSVRGLQAGDYDPEQLDGALGSVFGVDNQLIADGTYLIAEGESGLAGCGGWSRRRTLYGADAVAGRDDAPLTPGVDAAKIRAFFVDPGCARQGVGALILDACEEAAAAAGFNRLELGATLTGLSFYRRHGYGEEQPSEAPLPNGRSLTIVRMTKRLSR